MSVSFVNYIPDLRHWHNIRLLLVAGMRVLLKIVSVRDQRGLAKPSAEKGQTKAGKVMSADASSRQEKRYSRDIGTSFNQGSSLIVSDGLAWRIKSHWN